jgi:hypothetical protein
MTNSNLISSPEKQQIKIHNLFQGEIEDGHLILPHIPL